jgi:hypothetical protein
VALRDDILPDELTEEQRVLAERVFEDYFKYSEYIRSQKDEFLQPGERKRQPRPAKNINEVMDLINRIIQEKQLSEGIKAPDFQVKLTQEYPPVDLVTEEISYTLLRREPASTSRGRHFNQGRQEWKPGIRSIDDDPNNYGYRLITMGQKFENEIEMTCWAKTNKRANQRALWLENTMRQYAWYLKYEGVDEFYFLRRGRNIVEKPDGDNLVYGRPLVFFARTERLTHLSEPVIRRIIIKYAAGTSTQPSED